MVENFDIQEFFRRIKMNEYLEAALYLRDHGLDVNTISAFSQGPNGHIPIHSFMMYEELPNVESALRFGISPDTFNHFDETPIMTMMRVNTIEHERFELLIQYGADINIQNQEGYTAMMYAAQSDNMHGLLYGINAGADFSILNKSGLTAKEVARSAGRYAMADSISQWTDIEYEEDIEYDISR